MENASAAIDPAIQPKEKLIIALDVDTAAEARSLVDELRGRVGAFKVGMQLFTAAGPQLVREFVDSGIKVFLDLKFHDIPNTVAMAAVEAARLGVWMLNVHASGGREMMEATRASVHEACEKGSFAKPILIAVTVLTSSDQSTLAETGVTSDLADQVLNLAKLAYSSGFDGVVASPLEIGMIRKSAIGKDLLIVTPGIRPISATKDDQKRVMTFAEAEAAGANYMVVGRPVTQAPNKLAAIDVILSGQ
ncbi:MAG: orotidine-5'-phosphate decarboxylase [Acidobacteriota bacterium]